MTLLRSLLQNRKRAIKIPLILNTQMTIRSSNNVSQYIGNEINGAISSDQSDARPPTVVEVEKGTIYNIFVTKDLLYMY